MHDLRFRGSSVFLPQSSQQHRDVVSLWLEVITELVVCPPWFCSDWCKGYNWRKNLSSHLEHKVVYALILWCPAGNATLRHCHARQQRHWNTAIRKLNAGQIQRKLSSITIGWAHRKKQRMDVRSHR